LTTSEHEEWMSQPIDPLLPKRQRRKYRRYPRPECSPAQRAALLEQQQGRCALCGAEGELDVDHSYRSGVRVMACCAASTMPRGHVQGQPHALKAGTGLSTKSPS
jgi:hypothetical protein